MSHATCARIREERAEVIAKMRAMNEKAKAEGRSLSENDEKAFDRLEAKALGLSADLEREERALGIAPETPELRSALLGGGSHRVGDGPVVSRESRKLTLSAEERMVDWVASDRRSTSVFSRESAEDFSLGRFIRGKVTGDWTDADLERRALNEGTGSAGGFLTPELLSAAVIDRVRPKARVLEAGATVVPLESDNVAIPRNITAGSFGWKAENAAVATGDPTFDRVTFQVKTLAGLLVGSYELWEDMGPAAADLVTNQLVSDLAVELDRAALRGDGTGNSPTGVRNQSGVTVVANGANGTTISGWDMAVDAAYQVRAQSIEPNALIYAPRTGKSLASLKDTTNQPIQPPSYVSGLGLLDTASIPVNLTVGTNSDCSEIYAGAWENLLIGVRPSIGVRVEKSSDLDNMRVKVLVYLRADVQLALPKAFCVETGVRG